MAVKQYVNYRKLSRKKVNGNRYRTIFNKNLSLGNQNIAQAVFPNGGRTGFSIKNKTLKTNKIYNCSKIHFSKKDKS